MSEKGDSKALIVLIGGGHASGKKTVASDIRSKLQDLSRRRKVSIHIIHMNDYENSHEVRQKSLPSRFNFRQLDQDLNSLLNPSSTSSDALNASKPPNLILVEGLYALYDSKIRELAALKLFVNSDADTRLSRWSELWSVQSHFRDSSKAPTNAVLRDAAQDKTKLGQVLDEVCTEALNSLVLGQDMTIHSISILFNPRQL